MAYAHSRNSAGQRHDLRLHLESVADLAMEYASAFDGQAFARTAGLLHDVGKSSQAFQEYLFACEREPDRRHPTVDHKGAGCLAASDICDELSFLIHGHHGGLPNRSALRTQLKELSTRSIAREALTEAGHLGLSPSVSAAGSDLYPPFATTDRFTLEFFLRMTFSALVDADHLDTERHFSPETADWRGGAPSLAELARRLTESQRVSGKGDQRASRRTRRLVVAR
jgi:CRISPR-associated endonuclease/helicase Cas3